MRGEAAEQTMLSYLKKAFENYGAEIEHVVINNVLLPDHV